MGEVLRFQPFRIQCSIEFWQSLCDFKLKVQRLKNDPVSCGQIWYRDNEALRIDGPVGSRSPLSEGSLCVPIMNGIIANLNSLDDFTGPSFDRKVFVESLVSDLRNAAPTLTNCTTSWVSTASPLALVSFVDLKSYQIFFNAATPSLEPPISSGFTLLSTQPATVILQKKVGLIKDGLIRSNVLHSGLFLISELDASVEPFSEKFLSEDKWLVGFIDPGTTRYPGWPLRAILIGLSAAFSESLKGRSLKILGYRDLASSADMNLHDWQSLCFVIDVSRELPPLSHWQTVPGWCQWKDHAGKKISTQTVNLRDFLDSYRIAAEAVDLNVQLMKWRLVPKLEPERVRNLKVLLLGSGTLGCAVARCLIGWGVRHITFLDSGHVSFSNPVRQSLFIHEDAVQKAMKAEKAADRLKQIMPNCSAQGVKMEIPMPGHPSKDPDLRNNIKMLENLIETHDCTFMITDTRESRWLPSLIIESLQDRVPKPPRGICVALGFDSFLVKCSSYKEKKVACYFCNDVNAPSDSTAFRSLDQQCTVTRPGGSQIASALASELLVSFSQEDKKLLGETPDQIRGFLATYQLHPADTEPFKRCICCSSNIKKEYLERGVEFIVDVVQDSSILERMSTLDSMKQEADVGGVELADGDDW